MGHSVGIIWDSCFLNHDAGSGHPERPERLIAIREVLQEQQLWTELTPLETRKATREELERNHTPEHVTAVLEADGKERVVFDGDTQSSPGTTKAALIAAGGAVDLARAVWQGDVDRGFSFGRPPGHHAEASHPMGFCYFNNVAVAARTLLADGLSRVMIVDWDVHHGNGTQHVFEEDDQVLFLSTHQYPFYPGTGSLRETGRGKGQGFTVNVPMPAMQNDDDHIFVFRKIVRPIAEQFKPQIILLSAGYDSHKDDLLGSMKVTTSGFARLAKEMVDLADELCEGKLVAFLEGGYDLGGLSSSVAATIQVFLGNDIEMTGDETKASEVSRKLLESVRETFEGTWSLPE